MSEHKDENPTIAVEESEIHGATSTPNNEAQQSQVSENYVIESKVVEPGETKDEPTEGPRRSQRETKLTEKAREGKVIDLDKQMNHAFKHLSKTLTSLKELGDMTPGKLDAYVVELNMQRSKMLELHNQMRTVSIVPLPEINKAVDRMNSYVDEAIKRAQEQNTNDDTPYGDSLALLFSNAEKAESVHSMLSRSSTRSSTSSLHRDAAVKAAALQAELEAMEEDAVHEEELRQLEEAMKVKLRQMQKQKIARELRVEKEKLAIYEQELCGGVPHNTFSAEPPIVKAEPVTPSVTVDRLARKPEHCISAAVGTSRVDRPKEVHTSKTNLHPSAKEFRPAISDELKTLTEALAASVAISRLPAPEPVVFTGDPLSYPDWISSFSTLIESRGIPPKERIHYLKRYLGGQAREAVAGCFLLRGEQAYEDAKHVLEHRFGNPFAIAEAFRDKLDSWPKITGKNHQALRRLADFLTQCLSAMKELPGLQVLNDIRENRKILQKLPEWVVNRWSRVVAKVKKMTYAYPPFETFVYFLQEEAEIVCDPMTSIASSKGEGDQTSETRPRRMPGGRTMSTKTWAE